MRVALALGMLALLAAACRDAPLLSDVSVEPPSITPNRDGDADVARMTYTIGASAQLDVTLVAPDGATYPFRVDQPRAPGHHEALFGGIIDGRMVPDGEYSVRFTARSREDASETAVVERPLSVRGGDTEPPKLEALTVQPSTFTPNQDGIADRVSISYRLDEPAEVRVWLATADGEHVTDILEEQQSAKSAGEPGPHVYDFDAGVDADAPPPPDGDYLIVVEAVDLIGNVARRELPLSIRDGGQPRAAIVGDVAWSDTVVPLGATLTFTATVVNVGNTPIRTRGPEPGFVYDNDGTFNQQAPAEWLLWARKDDRTAAVRVPASAPSATVRLDLAGAPTDDASPEAAPTRDVMTVPDDEAKAVGPCGVVLDGGHPVADARVVAFESDGDNGVETSSDEAGRFCLPGLSVPEPAQRTYARSPGAIRLGLEYDERRSDIEYPFRWQLGRSDQLDACRSGDSVFLCLPPGATVEVGGAVRFVEPPFRRTTNAYLALMHEDVRRMQGPYNPQRLTIEY